MTFAFWVCAVLAIVGVGALIFGGIAWGNGKPHGVNSMLIGLSWVMLAIMLANGERDRQLRDRVTALEAQLAKQQPAAQNAIEQK